MRSALYIRVEGLQNTLIHINNYSENQKKEIKKVVRQTTNRTRRDMKAVAPVGPTGNLKASVRAKYFEGGLASTVVPRRPKGSHRHIVAYGTRQRRTRKGANRGIMPANPVMANVERNHEAFYQAEIRRIIARNETI